MYHYLRGSREYPWREGPGRAPAEIREDLAMIRELLRATQAALREAEARRESLLLAIEEGGEGCGRIAALEAVLAECERAKETLEELDDRADALREELRDVLYFLHGGVA